MDSDETAATCVIRLIGEVRVVYRGHVVHPRVVGGARCVEILAYLAVNRNREIPHEELSDLLWPKSRPQTWYAALRGVLSRVRETMDLASMPEGSVRSRNGYVRLSLPDGLVTDIELIRRCCAATGSDLIAAVADARRALGLTAEPVLVGAVGAWADEVRTEVEQLRLRAFEIDAHGSLILDEPARAIASAEGLLALDALRESAYRTVMSGYLSSVSEDRRSRSPPGAAASSTTNSASRRQRRRKPSTFAFSEPTSPGPRRRRRLSRSTMASSGADRNC